MRMHTYIHIYEHVHLGIYIGCTHTYTYLRAPKVRQRILMQRWPRIYICICIYTMYIYIYIYMYIYIMHAHTQTHLYNKYTHLHIPESTKIAAMHRHVEMARRGANSLAFFLARRDRGGILLG